jgi:glycosyltransferase involved in cell wall biosynthesis
MHIFHIIVSLNVGGAELMLKRLIESHIDNNDYCHTVISLRGIGTVGIHLQKLGIRVYALGMRSAFDTPQIMWRMICLLRTFRPDVVQTWMYHADLLGGLAARIVGNRNIIWGIRATDLIAVGYSTLAVRQMCVFLSWVVPNTIVCAAYSSRRSHIALGYCADRIVVIPNGFDLSHFFATNTQRNALRSQCGFTEKIVVVGNIGRFHQDKDLENFVRSAGLVAKQYINAFFLLIGPGMDTGNKLLADFISATEYSHRFVLLGERSDVPVCLAAMDIFCLSSRTEGFPNVVGEAMAMGLPCVVTDVGDAALLVAETGVVVPKEDSPALAQGISYLLTMTPEDRIQLGQTAKVRIQAMFSMKRTRERFELIYKDITKS